jgi:hypothetical protein
MGILLGLTANYEKGGANAILNQEIEKPWSQFGMWTVIEREANVPRSPRAVREEDAPW